MLKKSFFISLSTITALFIFGSSQVFCQTVATSVFAQGQGQNNFTELSYNSKSRSIFGIFKSDGSQISIETRRGRETSNIMRKADKTTPLYEIDVRLLDRCGRPFFVQVGGHDSIEQSWGSSLDTDFDLTDEEKTVDSQKTFTIAKKMVMSLMGSKFKKGLMPEYEAIKGILPLIESALAIERFENVESEISKNLLASASCTDRHYIAIWKKGAFFPNNQYGDHSGTVFKVISGGCTYMIWSACNHGTCPGTGGMYLKCSTSFPDRCGLSMAPPMCSTPFQWDQSDWWNDDGRHVCNDDTYIQYYRIKYNTNPSTTGDTCSDTYLRRYAPSCW